MDVTQVEQLMQLPVSALRERARIPFELTPDIPSLLDGFAHAIVDEIEANNRRGEPTRLILPVGPVAHYKTVVALTQRRGLSWKNVYTFNMDEFLDWEGRPIPVSHPLSFEGFMRRELFEKVGLPEDHCFFPHPFRPDEISERIVALGGIDCCYGGIGYHGHVAFNEPPNTRWMRISEQQLRDSRTRVVVLGDDSIVVQSIHCSGGNPAAIPPMAVTLGMKDILASRKIRLYCAAGARHRAIFRIAVAGSVTTDFPATLVQGHPDAKVFTDEATAQPVFPSLL